MQLTTKHRKNVFDTAFERLKIPKIILLHDNNLDTIRVPHGTQKAQYFKRVKLNTPERGHLELWAVPEFFSKVFAIKTISASPTRVFVHFS